MYVEDFGLDHLQLEVEPGNSNQTGWHERRILCQALSLQTRDEVFSE